MTSLVATLQQPGFWHHDGFGMGWHWGWWLFWLVLAAFVVWALVRALGASGGEGGSRGREADPESVLRRRFAEGELSEEEFRERLRILRDSE